MGLAMTGPYIHPAPSPAHRRAAAAILLALGMGAGSQAGPPFLTADPEPVGLNHWEFYVFGLGDRTAGAKAISAPAVELNYGVAENTQFHMVAPVANASSPGEGWASGFGDTELGVKYRFLEETDFLPQIGIFPLAELATGDGARGLGNGRTWYQLPVWAQKSWGRAEEQCQRRQGAERNQDGQNGDYRDASLKQ